MMLVGLILLLIALLAGVTWANYRIASLNPRADHFTVYWISVREFLIRAASPYSDEVAVVIQREAYGVIPQESEHSLRPAYPLWAGLFLLPFALISDFTLSRALWMTLLETSILALAFAGLSVTRWRLPLWIAPVFFSFTLLAYPSFWPLLNGSLSIIASLTLASALLAIRSGRDELAGLLLALATIHPIPLLLALGFVLFWAASQRRWVILVWFLGILAFLTILAMFVMPDWPLQSLRVIFNRPEYPAPQTVQQALKAWLPGMGGQLGWGLTLALAGILLIEWLKARRKGFRHLVWTVSLTLAVSAWIGIPFSPANDIALFFPLIVVLAAWEERTSLFGRLLTLVVLLSLGLGLWVIYYRTVNWSAWPAQPAALLFPLPAFLLIGLYWVRWWAVREPRLFMDELRARQEG